MQVGGRGDVPKGERQTAIFDIQGGGRSHIVQLGLEYNHMKISQNDRNDLLRTA
jgi:hypothetical protein